MKETNKLIREIVNDIQHDMSDEEILALLASSKVSVNTAKEKYSLGQRAADRIAKFAGSWAFIFSFTGVLLLWMVINTILAQRAFDPYPFILLNLVLSCVAAIQAPLIMMSQNRQEEKDRRRAEGVNEHGIYGVNGELHALPLQPEEEQRHVEQQQDERQAAPIGGDLRQQHRRAGNAGVIEIDGIKENADAERVD